MSHGESHHVTPTPSLRDVALGTARLCCPHVALICCSARVRSGADGSSSCLKTVKKVHFGLDRGPSDCGAQKVPGLGGGMRF